MVALCWQQQNILLVTYRKPHSFSQKTDTNVNYNVCSKFNNKLKIKPFLKSFGDYLSSMKDFSNHVIGYSQKGYYSILNNQKMCYTHLMLKILWGRIKYIVLMIGGWVIVTGMKEKKTAQQLNRTGICSH